MPIHDDAWNGSLTAEKLKEYISSDPNAIDSVGTITGKTTKVTPLIAAVWQGKIVVVKLLLSNKADPNKFTTRYTPLYYATVRHGAPADNRLAIVRALLVGGAKVDSCSNKPDDYTPLMNAVAEIHDANVVHELLDQGANKSEKRGGTNAEELAKQWNMERELLPRDVRNASRKNIVYQLLAVVQAITGWVNAKLGGVLSKVFGFRGIQEPFKSSSDPPAEPESSGVSEVQDPNFRGKVDEVSETIKSNPQTKEEFVKSIGYYVSESGLDKFFAPNDPFLEKLASKAAALRADPSNTIANSPENMKRLVRFSMYQPVIYCDDSGSMRRGTRWADLQELVNRIARIATMIVPDDCKVELQFINSAIAGGYTASEMEKTLKDHPGPQGGTNIGTNLESKILEPLVYSKIKSKELKRPYLICTITDGVPDPEPTGRLQEVVEKCRGTLVDADFEPTAVRFLISQIGDDEGAADFLSKLAQDDQIQDVVQVTAEKLDAQFKDLRGNEQRLEEWLLKVLTSPIMDQGE